MMKKILNSLSKAWDKFLKFIGTGRRRLIVLCIMALSIVFLIISISFVVAYFFNSSTGLTNKFESANIYEPTIIEDFTDGDFVKKNVKVKVNDDSFPCYVRVKVVFNWKDDDGNILAVSPTEGVDYTISYKIGKWNKGSDGFYYYNKSLTGETDILIEECSVINSSPAEGYRLNVDVLVQSVQAEPSEAVIDSWGVVINSDGTIIK